MEGGSYGLKEPDMPSLFALETFGVGMKFASNAGLFRRHSPFFRFQSA
jgi:hypothetical protein